MGNDQRTSLQDIVDLHLSGEAVRVYVVVQSKDGALSEFQFDATQEEDLSSS